MTKSTPAAVAVVTGASSGIGAAYARNLAARGYDLLLVARRGDRLDALAQELASLHDTQVQAVVADLTDEAGLRAVEAAIAANPRIEILVNSAGNGRLVPTIATSQSEAVSTIDLNMKAIVRLTMAALPGLLANDRGGIINIASALAVHAMPVTTLYSATKAFVMTYSRGVQQEVANTNLHVQAVLAAGTISEFADNSGLPMSNFDPSLFMTAEDLVKTAMAGFDRREAITVPSLEDVSLWDAFDAARVALFAGTQSGKPASRYA
jgi:short-subunit dehydrogenase